jgi:uncharacterized protein (TIGR04255 family)
MDWEPARADHSIDRVIASITLVNRIDPNAFDDLVVAARKVAAAHQLTDRVDLQEPLEIPADTPTVIFGDSSVMPPRRVVFRRLEVAGMPVEELSISFQRITFLTLRYRRWEDFNRLIDSTIETLDQAYAISKMAKFVRLEYLDRFLSAPGGADHFQVIAKNSEFLVPSVVNKTAALHVHSGWFDFESANVRMLTNVNIDVHDAPRPPSPEPRRTILVLSMGQYEALDGVLDRPIERLGELHDYLKKLFGRIITAETAARVGLND